MPDTDSDVQESFDRIDGGVPNYGTRGDSYGTKTAAAGTELWRIIPPKTNYRARLNKFIYTAAGTGHVANAMDALAVTSALSEAAASATTIQLSSIPTSNVSGTIATGDWVVFYYEDGTLDARKVSGITLNTITVAALTKKISKGDPIWFLGAPADHDTDRKFTLPASTTTTREAVEGLATGSTNGWPMLLLSDNATAAGTWEQVSYTHVKFPTP